MTHQISLVERRSNLGSVYSTSTTLQYFSVSFESITFWPQISVYRNTRTSIQIIVDNIHLVAGVGAGISGVGAAPGGGRLDNINIDFVISIFFINAK